MTARRFEAETKIIGRFGSSAITDSGAVREHNEDSYISCPDIGLWAVADGVGGHEAGDVASRMTTEALRNVPVGLNAAKLLSEVRVRLDGVHRELQEQAATRGADAVMATTVVVLLVRGHYFACLWAGDSRVYLLRGGKIVQLTRDHSLVQDLVDSKAITEAEAANHPRANVITRAVGAGGPTLALDKYSARLRGGDRFLLCSDGLWKTLQPPELAALLTADGGAPAERLLAAALQRQADDNVTAVTVEVGSEMLSFIDSPDDTDR